MHELFGAIKSGDAEAVEGLLDREPGLVDAVQDGVTAILWALYVGKRELARLLVERGASVSFPEAAALGELERVRVMLEENPALLDERSADGYPPLGLAIFFGQPDVARLLIERGADVHAQAANAQRVAPLHAAAAVCDRDLVRLLLDRG
ncbi:MAG TPA: ankyrin repeat domain-containing protein, partial [Thermoanaerobaculia bacterium]